MTSNLYIVHVVFILKKNLITAASVLSLFLSVGVGGVCARVGANAPSYQSPFTP